MCSITQIRHLVKLWLGLAPVQYWSLRWGWSTIMWKIGSFLINRSWQIKHCFHSQWKSPDVKEKSTLTAALSDNSVITSLQTDQRLCMRPLHLFSRCTHSVFPVVMCDVFVVSPPAALIRKWMFRLSTAFRPKRRYGFCAIVLLCSCLVCLLLLALCSSLFTCVISAPSLNVPSLSLFFQSWSW